MKNKLLEIFAYIFGAIAVLSFGLMNGTPSPLVHYAWNLNDSYHAIMFASAIASLVLYWKTDDDPR